MVVSYGSSEVDFSRICTEGQGMRYDGWKFAGEEVEAAVGKTRYKQIGGLSCDTAGAVGVSGCKNQIDCLTLFLAREIAQQTDSVHKVPERSAGYVGAIL